MLRYEPYYISAPWGARRLETDMGRCLPDGCVGESWELVELGGRHSVVPQGVHRGKLLGDMWRAGLLGGSAHGAFPFILKWIDAAQKLSVQVHPDAAACQKLGKGLPKTEAWYVAAADPRASLLIGHYPGFDPDTLRQAAWGGTLQKWMYEIRPRPGDMFLLEAGTLHAIGAGFLLLEVQQPSDTTFRLYDWGRVGLDGLPRPLHVDEAVESVAYSRAGAPRAYRQAISGPCFTMHHLRAGTQIPPQGLRVLVGVGLEPSRLLTGRGEDTLTYGDVVVAEPTDGFIQIQGGPVILITEPHDGASPLAL